MVFVALAAWACTSPVAPAPTPAATGPSSSTGSGRAARLDVLDFIIGSPETWPRYGGQWQHQVVDSSKRDVCWVKYGNPRMFECWRWDEEWIHHKVDHGIDGETGESYEFTDGRWLPRWIEDSGVWSLDVPGNRVRWFEPDCQLSDSKSREQPYRLRAWLERGRDAGPDLGVRDVLVLEYTPDPGREAPHTERFQFARGAGWFSWEDPRKVVRFDRFGGPVRQRAKACGE